MTNTVAVLWVCGVVAVGKEAIRACAVSFELNMGLQHSHDWLTYGRKWIGVSNSDE